MTADDSTRSTTPPPLLVTPLPEPTIEAPGAPTQSVTPEPDNPAQQLSDGPAVPEPAVTPVEVPPADSQG